MAAKCAFVEGNRRCRVRASLLKVFLLAASIWLPLTLHAPYLHGSVAVLQAGGDYIVVAADSMRVGPRRGQVSYQACKVFALGNQLVYAAVGISSKQYEEGSAFLSNWKTADLARQEYDYFAKRHAEPLIENVAAGYGRELAAKINHDLKMDSSGRVRSFLWSNQGAGRALFAGFDEKHQRVILEVNVAFSAAGAREVTFTSTPHPGNDNAVAQVIGDTSVAEEYAEGRTERSRGWRTALQLENAGLGLKDQMIIATAKIAELTEKNNPSQVGGPIDVILVTRKAGITWVRRKAGCGRK